MFCFRLRQFDFHVIVSLYLSDYDSDYDSVASENQPLEVNNGGLKIQTVDFQLLANSRGMKNKLGVLQLLNYPARKR